MEAFSLLNYWKNTSSGGGVSSGLSFFPPSTDSSCRYSGEATTIVTSVSATETEDETLDEDDGPFFDLKFSAPPEEEEDNGEDSDCTYGGCELKFALSPCSGGEDRVDPGRDFSPSDDVYFKGQIIEEAEPPFAETEQTCSVKAPAAQLSASILKSATKLRVFMLGMKKSKLIQDKSEANFGSSLHPPQPPSNSPESRQKSTVTANLKAEEVPIISLFARDSSSSSSSSSSSKKQNGNESVVSEENRFVQKYLKKVKPLYVRVSRRYGEKLKHSDQLTLASSAPSTRSTVGKTESPVSTISHKQRNVNILIPAGLKVVRKHLGKSRSSSSTTEATTTPSSTAKTVATTTAESRRRDDSLLQQQDSIRSAILHCKRSFNSSRDKDSSVLPRSVSDPSSYDK
ncbi:unnamed protein product [Cochlearia groenlandica]